MPVIVRSTSIPGFHPTWELSDSQALQLDTIRESQGSDAITVPGCKRTFGLPRVSSLYDR